MIEFIIEYWIEFLFGIFGTVMIAWVKTLQTKLKKKQEEQDALREGMKAILHDMLFQLCEKYLALGYIPVAEAEDILDRAKVIYKAYKGLKGNGTGTTLYEKFVALPIK